jgi:nucleoside-triphosphate--adenylate kinase
MSLASPEEESRFLLILGKPGGGKGTISKKILDVSIYTRTGWPSFDVAPWCISHYGWIFLPFPFFLFFSSQDFPKLHHISTGDLLRQHVRSETDIGKEAKKYMDEGKLVPDSVMVNLVMQDAAPYVEEGWSLLLDGFPRTIHQQAKALDAVVNVDLVINFDIPTETIVERISDRWIHPASGRDYSYSYKPPKVKGKDEITGNPLVQRDDDKLSSVRNRLALYDKVSWESLQFLSITSMWILT